MTAPDPICLVDIELGQDPPDPPLFAPDGRRYSHADVVLRVHGVLVGGIALPMGGGAELAAAAADALHGGVEAHLRADSVCDCRLERARLLGSAPTASVIIASRDGERTLGDCLDSLMALDYPDFEVIVVDSASRSDGVRSCAARYGDRVRYVREERPGVARAHNTGLAHACGELAAFADDDVVVDRLWLAQLAAGFALADDVACVTGLILPAELETPAQVWLDGYWGFDKGFRRRIFRRERCAEAPLHPYAAGRFGSGANMAFRVDALRAMGGFDPALGTGSLALGGDDLAAFFGIIEAGHALVYEPTAMVRHRHRHDYESLRRQAYCYGVGLTAYFAKIIADDPRRALELGRRTRAALAHLLSPSSPKNAGRPRSVPAELARIERRGMAVGALAYARSRQLERAVPRRVGGGLASL